MKVFSCFSFERTKVVIPSSRTVVENWSREPPRARGNDGISQEKKTNFFSNFNQRNRSYVSPHERLLRNNHVHGWFDDVGIKILEEKENVLSFLFNFTKSSSQSGSWSIVSILVRSRSNRGWLGANSKEKRKVRNFVRLTQRNQSYHFHQERLLDSEHHLRLNSNEYMKSLKIKYEFLFVLSIQKRLTIFNSVNFQKRLRLRFDWW